MVRQSNSKQQKQKQQVRYTPFADVGSQLGGMFGPVGRAAGKWLGSGIGALFGSGDYKISGAGGYNVLTSPNQIPKFVTNKASNIVTHREYLGDITGSTGFKATTYSINPGNPNTFPWLSTIAANFEQYKLHGLVFEFKSTSSDSTSNPALGTVIMATQYDPYDPGFSTKMSMENYEYAVSTKPSQSMLHGVECAPSQTPLKEMYVQGAVPNGLDRRFSDMGTFTIATTGMPSEYICGELWCSFVVELIKPKINATVGGSQYTYKLNSKVLDTAFPFGGSIHHVPKTLGTIDAKYDFLLGPSITLRLVPGNFYSLTIVWESTGTTPWAFTGLAYTGAVGKNALGNGTGSNTHSGHWVNPGTGNIFMGQWFFQATTTTTTITATGFNCPNVTGTTCDVTICAVDNTAFAI